MTDPNDIMFGGVRWMDKTASPYGERYEEIYQAFKARLMRELHTDGGEWIYDNAAGKMVRKTARLVDTADATAGRG